MFQLLYQTYVSCGSVRGTVYLWSVNFTPCSAPHFKLPLGVMSGCPKSFRVCNFGHTTHNHTEHTFTSRKSIRDVYFLLVVVPEHLAIENYFRPTRNGNLSGEQSSSSQICRRQEPKQFIEGGISN